MPRASREQQAAHHEQILERASHLVRERGPDGFSVPELMAEVGLTHGGFYKHFSSKDDLVAQAGARAFTARAAFLSDLVTSAPDAQAARTSFVEQYLSTDHRDHPGDGCPTAALVGAAAPGHGEALREPYLDGVRSMLDSFGELHGGRPGDGSEDPAALAGLATLLGAVLLSRATSGDALSERFLAAAREQLLGDPSPDP